MLKPFSENEDFFEYEDASGIDRLILKTLKNFKKWKKSRTKVYVDDHGKAETYFLGIHQPTLKKFRKITVGLAITATVLFAGYKVVDYVLRKFVDWKQENLVGIITDLKSENKELVKDKKNLDMLVDSLQGKVNTMANEYYFPAYYQNLPETQLTGIIESKEKETIKYMDKQGKQREFLLPVYKVYEKGNGLVSVVSEIDLGLGDGGVVDVRARRLENNIFDFDPFCYEVLGGQPITRLRMPSKYFIRAIDLTEKVQPDTGKN